MGFHSLNQNYFHKYYRHGYFFQGSLKEVRILESIKDGNELTQMHPFTDMIDAIILDFIYNLAHTKNQSLQ